MRPAATRQQRRPRLAPIIVWHPRAGSQGCYPDKKRRALVRTRLRRSSFNPCLDDNDIFGLRTFLALSNGELDLLSFDESFETRSDDRAIVGEHVGSGILFDETETFGLVEPFNGSFNGI